MKRSTCTLKLNKISRFDIVIKKLMNLSFFTKFFDRRVQLSSSLVKRSPTLRALVSTKTKCIKLIFIGKITLVPVAFLMALSIYSFSHELCIYKR